MYRQVSTTILLLVLVACADESETTEPEEPAAQTPTSPTDSRAAAADPVAAAVADLAAHADVDSADVQVVTHEQVTWRDGSLGCPEPGKFYTQALVDGYRIVLRLEGRTYHYHGARDKPPFRCDNPSEAAVYPPGGTTR